MRTQSSPQPCTIKKLCAATWLPTFVCGSAGLYLETLTKAMQLTLCRWGCIAEGPSHPTVWPAPEAPSQARTSDQREGVRQTLGVRPREAHLFESRSVRVVGVLVALCGVEH